MISRVLCILIYATLVTACGSSQERDESATVDDRSTGTENSDTRTFGTGEDDRSGLSALDDPASPLSVRIVYFEYDSSDVLPAYREVIEAHANYLAQNPNVTISLEGHADERGTREYNLALGERRAQGVKQHMMVFGPTSSQIRVTSYGEERPVSEGHAEEAWSQNRRVEIIY